LGKQDPGIKFLLFPSQTPIHNFVSVDPQISSGARLPIANPQILRVPVEALLLFWDDKFPNSR
jgi:hypothetical protein